jgi:hypothetical protein
MDRLRSEPVAIGSDMDVPPDQEDALLRRDAGAGLTGTDVAALAGGVILGDPLRGGEQDSMLAPDVPPEAGDEHR